MVLLVPSTNAAKRVKLFGWKMPSPPWKVRVSQTYQVPKLNPIVVGYNVGRPGPKSRMVSPLGSLGHEYIPSFTLSIDICRSQGKLKSTRSYRLLCSK